MKNTNGTGTNQRKAAGVVVDLCGEYRLRAEFLDVGPERFQEVLNHAYAGGAFGILRTSEHRRHHPNTFPYSEGSIPATVPCDVISPLLAAGLMEEPLIGTNAKDMAWLCDLSWWFIREFEADELLQEDEVILFAEMLDEKADLILNGIPIGHHANAFRPFEKDVKKYLRSGKNQLIIRLTSGTEDHYIQDSVSYYCCTDDGTKNQRAYLRKPQFTYGWDWCPSVPTCGIGGRLELRGRTGAEITGFRADTVSISDEEAVLALHFEIEKTDMACAETAQLFYEIKEIRPKPPVHVESGKSGACGNVTEVSAKESETKRLDGSVTGMQERSCYLAGGLNFIEERVTVAQPRLWWPNGYGEPSRYEVRAWVVCREIRNEMKPAAIGIRTVELQQDIIDEDQRRFDVVVNGVRVFCKGGNWVPPDSVYLRAGRDKYRALLLEAKALHFNMLRVWGGGLYAPDFFYEDCSELGILVMQDFMYSCAFYPDHLDSFLAEAGWEAQYQVRRLAHYPAMAIWTGNNEIAESWTDWWREKLHSEYDYGRRICHELLPRIVRENSPGTPYMPSTPYYGSFTDNVREGKVAGMSSISRWGKRANNPLCGDVHAWNYFLNDPKTRYTPETVFEIFDRFPARFCSEYGFWGPLTEESMRRCLGSLEEFSVENPAWQFHGEKPEKREAILAMIGSMLRDPKGLPVRDYLLYGGITQGILYQELAEAMRIKKYGSGFLIWMFNDAWPETGWSVVDYYLTRKISYYYLKRAFSPRIMILRTEEGTDRAVLTLINETEDPMEKMLEYGTMRLDGSGRRCFEHRHIKLQPHERLQIVLEHAKKREDFLYVIDPEQELNPCTDLRPYYRRYELPVAEVKLCSAKSDGSEACAARGTEGKTAITLCSESFVPCVYLTGKDSEQRFEDNYFPMLPGEIRTVYAEGGCDGIEVKTVSAAG